MPIALQKKLNLYNANAIEDLKKVLEDNRYKPFFNKPLPFLVEANQEYKAHKIWLNPSAQAYCIMGKLDNLTVLDFAVLDHNVEMLKILLNAIPAPTNTNSLFDNLYGIVIQSGNRFSEIFALLIELPGVDVNAFDEKGRTHLYMAVDYGHLEAVRKLIQLDIVDIHKPSLNGPTPLQCAINNIENPRFHSLFTSRKKRKNPAFRKIMGSLSPNEQREIQKELIEKDKDQQKEHMEQNKDDCIAIARSICDKIVETPSFHSDVLLADVLLADVLLADVLLAIKFYRNDNDLPKLKTILSRTAALSEIAGHSSITSIQLVSNQFLTDFKFLFFDLLNFIDISGFNDYLRISKIDINEPILDDDNNTTTMLGWAVINSIDNGENELIQHLLNLGAYPNPTIILEGKAEKMIPYLLSRGEFDLAKLFLASPDLTSEDKDEIIKHTKLSDLPQIKDFLLESEVDGNTPLCLNDNLRTAMMDDNVDSFNQCLPHIQLKELNEIFHYLYDCCSKNIILDVLKKHNPFRSTYIQENVQMSFFAYLLLQNNITIIQELYDYYFEQNKEILMQELNLVKIEIASMKGLHISDSYRINNEINRLILQVTNAIQLQGTSEYYDAFQSSHPNDSRGMSYKKFYFDKFGFLPPKSSASSTSSSDTDLIADIPQSCAIGMWFDDKTPNKEHLKDIEAADTPSYLVLLPDVDQSPNQVLTKNGARRFIFDDKRCLKKLDKIDGFDCSVTFVYDGKKQEFNIAYELKHKDTLDRILIASAGAKEGEATLYIAFEFVKAGLHTDAARAKYIKTFKQEGKEIALDLDFLFNQSPSLANQSPKP